MTTNIGRMRTRNLKARYLLQLYHSGGPMGTTALSKSEVFAAQNSLPDYDKAPVC